MAASVAAAGETLTLISGTIESVAWAFLEESACGVAVMVTLFGFGAAAGAVYCAETVETFPFCVCVVVPLIAPHEAPLHPGPLNVHAITVLASHLETVIPSGGPATFFATHLPNHY